VILVVLLAFLNPAMFSRKLSPQQAEQIVTKSSGKKFDSMGVGAFVKAFGEQAQGARA
jgi:HD-GYP domain-containing protein (c-di-GMP phosphodiesterase class II)